MFFFCSTRADNTWPHFTGKVNSKSKMPNSLNFMCFWKGFVCKILQYLFVEILFQTPHISMMQYTIIHLRIPRLLSASLISAIIQIITFFCANYSCVILSSAEGTATYLLPCVLLSLVLLRRLMIIDGISRRTNCNGFTPLHGVGRY